MRFVLVMLKIESLGGDEPALVRLAAQWLRRRRRQATRGRRPVRRERD